MLNIILAAVLANVLACAVMYIPSLASLVSKNKSGIKCLVKNAPLVFLVFAILQAVFVICAETLIKTYAFCNRLPSDSAFAIFVFLFVFSTVFSLGYFSGNVLQSSNLQRFFRKSAVCCMIVFMIELVVFNFVSFNKDKTEFDVPLSGLLLNETLVGTDEIKIKNNDILSIIGEGDNVGYIDLEFEGYDNDFKITTKIKDDNKKNKFVSVAATKAACERKSAGFSIKPYGTLYAVEMKFLNVNDDEIITVKNITMSSSKPFSFNYFRFFLVLFAALTIIAINAFGLLKIKFDPKKASHQVAVWALAVLCVSVIPYFKDFKAENVEYPLKNVAYADAFSQMFDSLQKDIPYLDIEVDEELLKVENVYDESQISEIPYLWDRAFYEGKYYCYFGIAPTLTFWCPYYKATGELPSQNLAHMFAALISTFALFGAALEFLKRYSKEVSAIMLIIALLSLEFMSGIPLTLFLGDGYGVSVAFALMYLYLSLFFGFAAANSKYNILRSVLLAVSGVCFVLCVASRPTIAFGAIILIPAFISMIISKDYKKSSKISGVLSFSAPILAGFAMIGKYNTDRFGSPFDFGMKYQLTVCDVSAKTLDLTSLPAALFHYFAAPFNLAIDFPYVAPRQISFENYGQYTYSDTNFGVFCFWAILLGLFAIYMVLKQKGCNIEKKAVYALAVCGAVFIAFVDFCFAGNNLRYIADILPMLSIVCVCALLECQYSANKHEALAKPVSSVVTMVFLQAVAFSILFAIGCSNMIFLNENVDFYYFIKDIVVFWR